MLGNSLSLSIGSQQQASSGGGGAAVTLNPTSGVNKYSGITLTNGSLTVEADTSGNFEGVRATRGASAGNVQFEVTVNNNNNITVSIEDGTQDFSVAGLVGAIRPGDTGHPTTGYSFTYASGSGFLRFLFNGGTQQFPSCTINNTDKLTFQINKGTGTIIVLLNGTQLGTTITGMTWTNWFAAAVVSDNAVTPEVTFNFAGPFSFGANAAY